MIPDPQIPVDGATFGVATMHENSPHDGERHPDGDEVLYLISGNGPNAHWFLNLQAEPTVTVELGDEIRLGTARVVTDPAERQLVGDLLGAKHAGWGGDPDIGLTFDAWCYDVPAAAIDRWRTVTD